MPGCMQVPAPRSIYDTYVPEKSQEAQKQKSEDKGQKSEAENICGEDIRENMGGTIGIGTRW